MTDNNQPGKDLRDLDARLDKARQEARLPFDKKAGEEPPKNALGLAFRVGVELVSALAVGVGVGWILDRWLGTGPWLLLVFILLGGFAGILNVYRYARGFGYGAGYQRDGKSGEDQKK